MVVLTIKFFLQKRIGFFLYITYKIRLNEIVHVNSINSSNKEGNEMKKQNVKLTPEALLLTAILGVPTGQKKNDGSMERFYPSSGPIGSSVDLVDQCVHILKTGSVPVKKTKLKMKDFEEKEDSSGIQMKMF